MTLHPQGIHHGPHPGAVEASKTQTQTNEIAVMVESQQPFSVMLEAEAVELKNYSMSWSTT
jgi:homogentisate 1,2-dioxygenase